MKPGDVVLLNSGELNIVTRVKVRQVQNGGNLKDEEFMYLLSNPSCPVPLTVVKESLGNLQSLFCK